MPVTPPELSLISYALVRPVVAYMNTNYTSIPLNFDVYLDKVPFLPFASVITSFA